MTTAFSRIKAHFANWREWELNPIVVKELRQSVRSWAVTGMLLLFLGVLFCTTLAFLISESFQTNANQRLGGDIFRTFTIILTGASLLFIPLYVGVRLTAERQESNLDLLYITTLTPERIIRGKFLCGAYMTVLFFSACMPFMAFTNLLRGVDLPTVLFVLISLFLAVCAAIMVAIFFACLSVSKVLKILVAIFGTLTLFPLIGGLVTLFFEMMQSGVGSMMIGGGHFWTGFGIGLGVILAGFFLLYFLSVALISPLSANRALPVRRYITLIWVLGAAFALYWVRKQGDTRLILPWTIASFVLLIAALVVVISNSDLLSLRVRRRIPARSAARALAFLFYNGAAGGLVWIVLLLGLTFATTSVVLHWPTTGSRPFSNLAPEDRYDFEVRAGAILLYAISYALTALLIHRRLFNRRSPRLAGILAVLLPGAWALVPYIVLFFANGLSFQALERSQLGNIFNVFIVKDADQKLAHLICAAVWLLLMLALNAKWFWRQLQQFRPLETPDPAAVSTPPSLPPPLPVSTGVN